MWTHGVSAWIVLAGLMLGGPALAAEGETQSPEKPKTGKTKTAEKKTAEKKTTEKKTTGKLPAGTMPAGKKAAEMPAEDAAADPDKPAADKPAGEKPDEEAAEDAKAGEAAKEAAPKKPTKTTAAERKLIGPLQKKLATKLNSAENPGDKNTWYVLTLRDLVQAQTSGASDTGFTLRLSMQQQEAANKQVTVVQGKREAAIAVARFMLAPNSAVAKLRQPGIIAQKTSTQLAGDKQWEFQAFKTEKEAETFAETARRRSDRSYDDE